MQFPFYSKDQNPCPWLKSPEESVSAEARCAASLMLKRNSDMRGKRRYNPEFAQWKSDARMRKRRRYIKFTDDMNRDVRRRIVHEELSPEQIAGRFRLKGKEAGPLAEAAVEALSPCNSKGSGRLAPDTLDETLPF